MATSTTDSKPPLAGLLAARMRELSLSHGEMAERIRRASRGSARPTRSSICHWCRGDVTPGPASVRWLAAALELDLPVVSALAEAQRNGGDVERRTFLVGMATTMAAATTGIRLGESTGRRVFDSIARDDSSLLTTVQTTHAIDWEISEYARRDGAACASLAAWMRDGASPVVRVNAAGILAKLRVPSVTSSVIASLESDDQSRHLYLTAVAHRALRLPWDGAGERVSTVRPKGRHKAAWLTDDQAALLASEARDGRDGAARWCSAVLLGVD